MKTGGLIRNVNIERIREEDVCVVVHTQDPVLKRATFYVGIEKASEFVVGQRVTISINPDTNGVKP